MLEYRCRRCSFKHTLFQKLRKHMWSEEHQQEARETFRSWDVAENSRSIVIYTPAKVPPPMPEKVVGIFHKLSVWVVDFVFWPNVPRMFILQVSNGAEVERLFGLKDELKLEGERVDLRRKADVYDNEWDIVIGIGPSIEVIEGPTKEPLLIELDTDSSGPQAEKENEKRRKKRKRNADNQDANGTTESSESESIGRPPPARPRLTRSSENEVSSPEVTIKIVSKMSEKFVKIFRSKIKSESGSDNKEDVKKQIKSMEERWIDIYLGFHDKLWPTCFMMRNRVVKSKRTKTGFQSVFDCWCLKSAHNKWLKNSGNEDFAEEASGKTKEFFEVLKNLTECNRRLKDLGACKSYDDDPLLMFTCEIIIVYDQGIGTNAELTLSNVQAQWPNKMAEVIPSIFKKLFKLYEKERMEKWSSAEIEKPLDASQDWSPILIKIE